MHLIDGRHHQHQHQHQHRHHDDREHDHDRGSRQATTAFLGAGKVLGINALRSTFDILLN